MPKDRIEIEKAENGYSVKVWKSDDDSKDEYGYVEPKVLVATSDKELLDIVKENL